MLKNSPAKTGLALSLLAVLTIIFAALFFIWRADSNISQKPADNQESSGCIVDGNLESKNISIGGKTLRVEVASEDKDKIQGLSGRECLNKLSGMLFEYEVEGEYCFWMKDMNFKIDIIWLNKNQEIVDIKSQADPSSYPQTFCPQSPANYILEVDGGLAEELGWQIGNSFKL